MNTSLDAAFPELFDKLAVLEESSSPAILAMREAQETLENCGYQATPDFWHHLSRASSLVVSTASVIAIQDFIRDHT